MNCSIEGTFRVSIQMFNRHFAIGVSDEIPSGELVGLEQIQLQKETPARRIALTIAETSAEMSRATELLNRRYAWRGYGADHRIGGSERHTTFISLLNEDVVGTITLGVDSPDGLAIDALFKSEVDKFRAAPGAQICELTKFAYESDVSGPSNSHLAALFHTVFLYGIHNYACTDLFIEVNPRHRRFYQAMLGFQPIGELRMNPKVDAPSQLMWINVSKIAEQIAYHAEPADAPSRSLYSLFLSQTEEAAIKSRLDLRRKIGTCGYLFSRELHE